MNRWTLIWAAVKALYPALKSRVGWDSIDGDIAFGVVIGRAVDTGYTLVLTLGPGVLTISARDQRR